MVSLSQWQHLFTKKTNNESSADFVHYFTTDSSSARQLAVKQGVGNLDGKIRWVQQHVLAGDVFLQQLPTIWNVADICAKSLPQQRIKL